MMGGLFEFGLGGFGEVDCHYFGFRFMFMWVFPLLVCEQIYVVVGYGYVPITCGHKEAAGDEPRGTASPVPVFPEQGSYGFLHLWIEAVGSAFFLGVGFVDSQLLGNAGQRFIWVFCG
jgi:hypothetical protein